MYYNYDTLKYNLFSSFITNHFKVSNLYKIKIFYIKLKYFNFIKLKYFSQLYFYMFQLSLFNFKSLSLLILKLNKYEFLVKTRRFYNHVII